MRADLHTHSDRSDGTDSPAQLMAAAVAAGLSVIALTDHDTTAGWAPAEAERPRGLTILTGVELSCASPAPDGPPIGVHLLGYLFDRAHGGLRAQRRRLRESRRSRAEEMIRRMGEAGLPVAWSRVAGLAGDGPVGRPHMARALVEAGWARSVDDAFARFLHHDSPYYVRKVDLDVADGVALIRAAGGVPVLAHPLARRRGRVVTDDVLAALATRGLLGLEVDHPDHEPADRDHLRGLADDLGLLATGSSDYHGRNKATPLGAELTAPEVVEALVALSTGGSPHTD
ncbi:MAG: PHP domain-containing protein [Actinomycetota bacterium]|nr:PHP domain-containing protein [Actinomycetota bacterium]